MPADDLSVLQASVTKTGTFNSTGLDLKTGTPSRGLVARVIYTAAATSSGAGSLTFRITESSDDNTYTGIYQTTECTVTLSTSAVAGELFIPFRTSKRYVRLELSALSGTGATVTYEADIVPSIP